VSCQTAQKGHKDIVALLIEKGADIEAASDVGSTPLYIAAQKGNVEVVEYLLRHGANVEAKFKNYYTPLYIACQNGWLPIVKMLLNAGANIEGIRIISTTKQKSREMQILCF
jgi:ankyrin repeat protein